MTGEKYFGFYWTLPVPWAGFRKLPKGVDAAAAKSRTIRYQRDMVRRWVREERGKLIGESAFLEIQPDRASVHVTPAIERVIRECSGNDATIILVNFSLAFGWRPHGPLWDRLHQPGVKTRTLYPHPTFMDGEDFDPVEHFRAWRQIEATKIESKDSKKQTLARTISELQDEQLTFSELADALNQRGMTTVNGKPWTADNLRHFIKGL